jgi:hypothetical protein
LASIRIVRLLLALWVSLWMAGAGCLWGCSNSATAAGLSQADHKDPQTLMAGDSCHSARTHDCCAKKSAKRTVSKSSYPELLSSLNAPLEGMLRDCPLAVNASAVIAKAHRDAPDTAHAPSAVKFWLGSKGLHIEAHSTPIRSPNRGPTYLRCCSLLI